MRFAIPVAALFVSLAVPAGAQEPAVPASEPSQPAPPTPAPPADPGSVIPPSGSSSPAAPGVVEEEAPEGQTAIESGGTGGEANFGADAEGAVAAISPFVGDVQVVGPWSDGDRRGIWRTVMLQSLSEVAGNRFFVQQIEEVNGEPAVSSTTEITEVGEINGAVVGYRVDEPSAEQPQQLTLFLDIVPLDGEISETYELFFTAGEPYVFGPASN